MTQKQNLKITLIIGLFLLSLGGWLLHMRIHPPQHDPVHLIPFLLGLASILMIPLLFFWSPLVPLAYLLNGLIVILGVITMAHFSLARLPEPADWSLKLIVFETTLADIVILSVKFILGKVLFDLEMTKLEKELPLRFQFWRWPNLGWWLVHLVGIGVIYATGNALLK
ncbi:MAG: hypothetical protein AAB019_06660 [Planctomycetota bacterium]